LIEQRKKMKRVIRNIPTKDLLLLLAQANKLSCPFVDLGFDTERKVVSVTPITTAEGNKRFDQGKEGTSMEDLINES